MPRERIAQDTVATPPDPSVVAATVKAIKSGKPLPKQPKTVVDPYVAPATTEFPVLGTIVGYKPSKTGFRIPLIADGKGGTTEGTEEADPAFKNKTVISEEYVGTGASRKKVTKFSDGTSTTVDDPDTSGDGNGTDGTDNGNNGTVSGLNTGPTSKSVDSIAAINALLSSYDLGDLSVSILESVTKGYSADTINLIMQDPNSKDPLALAYQKRFSANQIRAKAGKPVLSPSEYLQAEQTYAQIMQSHGVGASATRSQFATFIANDVSASEVNDRITLAVDRIQGADQATKDALKQFFPSLNQSDLVGAMLNPEEGLPALQRKVRQAEIGGAALSQGFDVSLEGTRTTLGADVLEHLGITKAQAQAGYSNISDILPTASKLSSIYGNTLDAYGQSTAEQEVFGGLASAKRKREKLIGREQATFGGSSGTLGASYGTPRSAFNKSSAGQI